MKLSHLIIAGLLSVQYGMAQSNKPPKDWHLKSDRGALNVEKAYTELLKGKQGRKIIVAVIDSGVDIEHEDLKDVIWTNPKEIPNNGKDDDKNGYIDDVHGWSFLGNKKGENVSVDTYELTREYVRLSKKYAKAKPSDKPEYKYWEAIKKEFEDKKAEIESQMAIIKPMYDNAFKAYETLKKELGKEEITAEDLENLSSDNEEVENAKSTYNTILSLGITLNDLKEYVDYLEKGTKYGYNPDFDPRKIVGDNYKKLKQKGYGCTDVKGPDAGHGTHVSGIIAAKRGNGLGIDGIADNVWIMPIRAVPDGDERDKDIANAIYYAVDNGAHIINMSFGKSYSPNKSYVDEAILYAESKGVLLVHAAGNDAKNLEEEPNFPNRFIVKNNNQEVSNWLEIGACGWQKDNSQFIASFSNYGKTKVHVFSPGVDIYAPIPDKNQYKFNSGTSMAAPATSGVAALIMSYYPNLTAKDVKEIILQSSVKIKEEVNVPGKKSKTQLSNLCVTGGVVNAYEALKLAEQKSKQK